MLSIQFTLALNNEVIKTDSKRITKIKSFINNYKWKRNKFSIRKRLLEKIEKNNRTIALNVLYAKKQKIYPASKYNSNREKQIILESKRRRMALSAVKNYQHH